MHLRADGVGLANASNERVAVRSWNLKYPPKCPGISDAVETEQSMSTLQILSRRQRKRLRIFKFLFLFFFNSLNLFFYVDGIDYSTRKIIYFPFKFL